MRNDRDRLADEHAAAVYVEALAHVPGPRSRQVVGA
jgi:hypothetical protein